MEGSHRSEAKRARSDAASWAEDQRGDRGENTPQPWRSMVRHTGHFSQEAEYIKAVGYKSVGLTWGLNLASYI